jgi:hypothetical protein
MTPEERTLLLTTARVMRAQLRSLQHLTKEDMDDIAALTDALAPFDPAPTGKRD